MPWLSTCDDYFARSYIVGLSDQAVALLWKASVWSMQELTDGRVSQHFLKSIRAKPSAVKELTDRGTWSPIADGFVIVDWKSDQTSSEEVLKRRSETNQRVRRHRNAVTNALPAPLVTPLCSPSQSPSPKSVSEETKTERDARVDWDFPKRVRSDFIKRYSQANACVPAETMLGKNLPKLIDWLNASAALQGVEPVALWVRLADAFFAAGPEATQRFHPSWLCSNPDQWLNPIATGADWKEQAAKTAAVRKLRVDDQLRAFRAEMDVVCTALRVSDPKLAEETRMQREREYSALYKQLHGESSR